MRLRTHYCGNAEGSTLRRTLGCLLAEKLGVRLRRVGSGRRYTFTNPGEQRLDTWMAQHTSVCWVACDRPWELESRILASGVRLPLNIDGNPCTASTRVTSTARLLARQTADQLDVVPDSGGPRRNT
jgi:hypothetical protein